MISMEPDNEELKEKEKSEVDPLAALEAAGAEAKEVIQEKAEVEEPKADEPKVLPPDLQARAARAKEMMDDLTEDMEKFKSGQAYLPGDLPITLNGIGGPGLNPGQRSVIWMDRTLLDSYYHFRWSHKEMVGYHSGVGYSPVQLDEFKAMVEKNGGQCHFSGNSQGHVFAGDLVLIACTQSRFEQLSAANRKKVKRIEGRAKSDLEKVGNKLGVEVYENDEGPRAEMLEKMQEYLTKELGADAVSQLLGG